MTRNPRPTTNWITDNTHPSHDWHADDDVMACDRCGLRTYNAKAKDPCAERKPTAVPTVYFDEKIGKLNRLYADLESQGENSMDQTETLRLIDDLARVIRMEAQQWLTVLGRETK